MNKILQKTILTSGLELQLILGDITTADVDSIVNPANELLKHGGGLAGLLSKKAGPSLQKQSNAWIKDHGPIKHQNPAYTRAGNLPFQYIIHAVGPVWGSGNEGAKLHAAVRSSMQLAERLNMTSLAIPAISMGIFGYPPDEASSVILNAIVEFASSSSCEVLSMIQLVLYDQKIADIFLDSWNQIIQ